MPRTHYFFSKLSENELELVHFHHRKEFDALLEDTFSESELKGLEKMLESMAPVFVEERHQDLSFDDYYSDRPDEDREFFEATQSNLIFENMPFFENNPLQVTYLRMLLSRVDKFLIDTGGVESLMNKEQYLIELAPFKGLESLIKEEIKPKMSQGPSDITDFLALDVYKELTRLRAKDVLDKIEIDLSEREKLKKIYSVMRRQELSPMEVQKKSGLIPKDFVDCLESLKFFLKRY
jgi:uncharacterized protein YfkK (UPF0435 family)